MFAFTLGTVVGAAGIVVAGVIVQTRIDYVG